MVSHQVSRVDTLGALNHALPALKTQIKDILAHVCGRHEMPESIASMVDEYYSRCLDYNIVGGKLARARTVCEALVFCCPGPIDRQSDKFRAAVLLAWCVEILQAFFLIEDDVMDRGETRRGQPCWYRVPAVGVANAINDGLLLEQVLYELIELNEYTKPIAVQAHRKLRDAAMRTVIGQHLDTCPPTSVLEYTRDQWLSVVRFKTAFYTFFLPCELGILVSGVKFTDSDLSKLRNLSLLLGELFQAQDDMLDCFGDPSIIGKIGRDIEERKCTWLWYTALEVCVNKQEMRQELVSLYSSSELATDPAVPARIKDLYQQLEIPSVFDSYASNLKGQIDSCIASIEATELQNLGKWLLESTVGRKK